jgi:FMN reductase [NAD(P)H]
VYHDYSPADIDKFYRDKEKLPASKNLLKKTRKKRWHRFLRIFVYTAKDNRFFSREFLELIKDKGFMNNEG